MKLNMHSTNTVTEAQLSSQSTIASHDRRRRSRIETAAVGYLLREEANANRADAAEPWEVRIHDLSRLGVGFVSGEPMAVGEVCRIRIGFGPMRLARRMRVVSCKQDTNNTYRIGAEFA